MIIRSMSANDARKAHDVFFDAVHNVEKKYYSTRQKDAWAPIEYDEEKFIERVSSGYALVAVEKDGEGADIIAGYGNIDDKGYIDHLYVGSAFQGRGVGTAICDELEKYAVNLGVRRLSVHASKAAKKFFLARGYEAAEETQVVRNGLTLTNFLMEKHIL